jgi:sugar O-acyltransferase (sialic acid O-acetyltransferase NeuD family)
MDTLEVRSYRHPVPIIQNIALEPRDPFCPPGMTSKTLLWKEWQFDEASQVCLPALANPAAKKTVVDFFEEQCGVHRRHYTSLIHPAAVIASTVTLGNGCFVEPGSMIASFTSLGFGVYVNRACSIGHHVQVGDFVNLGPATHVAGHCRIGDGVQLGIGAVVFDHITIGKGSVIGGGSVVTKDIPENVVAWGNPCKVIKPAPALWM